MFNNKLITPRKQNWGVASAIVRAGCSEMLCHTVRNCRAFLSAHAVQQYSVQLRLNVYPRYASDADADKRTPIPDADGLPQPEQAGKQEVLP